MKIYAVLALSVMLMADLAHAGGAGTGSNRPDPKEYEESLSLTCRMTQHHQVVSGFGPQFELMKAFNTDWNIFSQSTQIGSTAEDVRDLKGNVELQAFVDVDQGRDIRGYVTKKIPLLVKYADGVVQIKALSPFTGRSEKVTKAISQLPESNKSSESVALQLRGEAYLTELGPNFRNDIKIHTLTIGCRVYHGRREVSR